MRIRTAMTGKIKVMGRGSLLIPLEPTESITKPGPFKQTGVKKMSIYAHHLSLQVRAINRTKKTEEMTARYHGKKTHTSPNTIGQRMSQISFGLTG